MTVLTARRTAAAAATTLVAAAILVNGPSAKASDLDLVAHDEPGNEAFDDLGAASPNGPDLGDLLAFTQTVSQGGKTVGLVHVAAVGVDHKRHLSQAYGTLVLGSGSVELSGLVPMSPSFTLAVTGGTGHYAGAAGTLVFSYKGGQQHLHLHLLAR